VSTSVAGGNGEREHVTPGTCERCLARAWLLGRLSSRLERKRSRIDQLLGLDNEALLAAVGGRGAASLRQELDGLKVDQVRARVRAAGLETICRCDPAYPAGLRALASPPAVLYVAGGLERLLERVANDAVAIVGSRRPTTYGLEVAHSLGRGLGCAGITVVSGMALGIDSAGHAGALEANVPTVAVLPASADRPYPAAKRGLYRRILARGAAVSELGPGTGVWRWMFPARNRIIAALAVMTVVVEAGDRSGALVTARIARGMGRPVGAVPGRVVSPQAAGPNGLLAAGACVVRGPEDVLDHVFGAGVRRLPERRRQAPSELRPLLDAIAEGHDTAAALAQAGFAPERGLAALAALELEGYVRRGAGGRFSVVP
jgi:DNA processing protein